MTTPAHTNTAAEAVLLDHRWIGYSYQCRCQARGEPTDGLNVDDTMDPEGWARHLIRMLAAASLLADPTTRTEWGVRARNGYVIPADDRLHAGELQDPGEVVVRRTVTDWTPAEEGE